MVGDTPHDVEAGRAARFRTVGALYGFRPAETLAASPDYTISAPGELLPILRSAG